MNISDKSFGKKVWLILLDVMLVYAVLSVGLSLFCGLREYKQHCIDDDVTAVVYKSDGSVLEYAENKFDEAITGDVVCLNIKLPEKAPYKSTTLCTIIYNCAVEAECDGKVFYEYGKDIIQNDGELGNIFVSADIPDYAWGKTVTIKCTIPIGGSLNSVNNVILMPSRYALRYVLINHEFDFIFCITLVGFSIFALLIFITTGKMKNIDREGIYLFIFLASVGIWQLGYYSTMYIFINNPVICANIEYTAMFFFGIPLGVFLSAGYNRRFKKVFLIMASVYAVVFIVSTILNYTTTYHYYRLVHFERYLIAAGMVAIFVIVILNRKTNNMSEKILGTGVFGSMFIMLLEVMRYEIRDNFHELNDITSVSLASFGIMIFAFSLLYEYYNKLYTEMLMRKHLEQVAYTDGMTGIANRTAVDNFMNDLDSKSDYGIVFFDVNGLKKANDVYGHETGDKLITVVAAALKESFENSGGFYGRYGGDEFVAGYNGDGKRGIEESLSIFNEMIENANKAHELPFEVGVAYGSYVNDPESPMLIEDAVKKADSAMYAMKKEMKNKILAGIER